MRPRTHPCTRPRGVRPAGGASRGPPPPTRPCLNRRAKDQSRRPSSRAPLSDACATGRSRRTTRPEHRGGGERGAGDPRAEPRVPGQCSRGSGHPASFGNTNSVLYRNFLGRESDPTLSTLRARQKGCRLSEESDEPPEGQR